MRILLAVPVFARSFGGPVAVVEATAKELARRHDVTVVTTNAADRMHDSSQVPSIEDSNGYRILRYPRMSIFGSVNVSPAMSRLLREMPAAFDIVHVHSWRQFQDIAVHHYAIKSGTPYVLQAHGSLLRIEPKERLKLVYDLLFGYKALRDASKVIALSEIEAGQYRSMGVPDEKIAIIPNGIDPAEFKDLPKRGTFRSKFGLSNDDEVLLYVGRIHRSKGLALLLQAFELVLHERTNARLVVVGPDDGYLDSFLELASALQVEKAVLWTGFLSERDKMAALVDGDVFVTPNYQGFPITFLEACIARCPIVTTSRELGWVDDQVGLVTEAMPTRLAETIIRIIQSDKLREKFSTNSRSVVERFTVPNMVREMEKVYESAISQKHVIHA